MMLCPYRHKEMKKGFLQANSNILFSESKHLLKMRPSNCDDIMICEQCMSPAHTVAFYCETCDKLLIDHVRENGSN